MYLYLYLIIIVSNKFDRNKVTIFKQENVHCAINE